MASPKRDDRERDRDGQVSSELSAQEIDILLGDLEIKMERLKVLYEQYFLGVERAEPVIPRKDVVRVFHNLSRIQIRNTALRFRHQTLLQRWNLLQTRWGRTLREIERGTYVRHVARAQRRGVDLPDELKPVVGPAARAATGSVRTTGAAKDDDEDSLVLPIEESGFAQPKPPAPPRLPALFADESESDLSGLLRDLDDGSWGALDRGGGAKPATPPAPVAARPSPPAPPSRPPPPPAARPSPPPPPPPSKPPVPGMSEDELRDLHRRYSAAAGTQVRYEKLVATLEKQVPSILQQHGCSGVRFDVVVHGGKAVLKATPRK